MENEESGNLQANHAWQIGAAIEAGIDAREARRRLDAGEIVAPAAGVVIGGGVAATATGLGGVGLAFGGGAIGIGAATAVAAPAVAVGAVSYGIYRSYRDLGKRSRVQVLRRLVEYFRSRNQEYYADRVFHVEGRGHLEDSRKPPTLSSAKTTLFFLSATDSTAMMGLFCSPEGNFVLTYDLEPNHWAYVMAKDDDNFTGDGTDLRGQGLRIDDLDSVDMVLRVLEREGFVTLRQGDDDLPNQTATP